MTNSFDIGDRHEIHLDSLTYSNSAVGRIGDVVTFVAGGVSGDTVLSEITKIKKKRFEAKIIELISPSSDRVDPPCDFFQNGCGGCQWQQIDYVAQIGAKKRILTESLKRISKLTYLPDITLHPANHTLNYRTHIRLTVAEAEPTLKFGFKQKNTHQFVQIDQCKIADPQINLSLSQVTDLIRDFQVFSVKSFSLRMSKSTGEVMLILICSKREKPNLGIYTEDLKNYPKISSVYLKTGERGSPIWVAGKRSITEICGGISYEIGVDCFFQTSFSGLGTLVEIIERNAQCIQPLTTIDAHCGIGTFTLPIAKYSQRILGVDLHRNSVNLAIKNAKRNQINNVEFQTANLAQIEGVKADFIILNPPRAGCWKEDLVSVTRILPSHVMYVSCNPTTLARDLVKLKSVYKIENLDLVDLFPMTYHFETIAWLQKQ